eukprot:16449667-Heterocapsa_arctica.AAC.1
MHPIVCGKKLPRKEYGKERLHGPKGGSKHVGPTKAQTQKFRKHAQNTFGTFSCSKTLLGTCCAASSPA